MMNWILRRISLRDCRPEQLLVQSRSEEVSNKRLEHQVELTGALTRPEKLRTQIRAEETPDICCIVESLILITVNCTIKITSTVKEV